MIRRLERLLKDLKIVELKPPLFYSTRNGIRFEMAIPGVEHETPVNLRQIQLRSSAIFEATFRDTDELMLITDVHLIGGARYKKTNVYRKYVKNKDLLMKLQTISYRNLLFEEADEELENMVTHRFVLPCRKSDLRYKQLLSAISYEDFSHPTKIIKNTRYGSYDLYVVNVTQEVIYHLYDDRGCDVVATNKKVLQPLYEQFNPWILDYDRERIDLLFQS